MRSEGGLLASLLLIGAAPLPAATLTADVGNVRNERGHVRIYICTEDHFLKANCPYSGEAPARPGVTTVIVHGVSPGRYAIQAYHDENDDHDVDRGLFGIPKEGIGFSRDPRILFGPPRWTDAMFAFDSDAHVSLKLRYFMGASGPPRAH